MKKEGGGGERGDISNIPSMAVKRLAKKGAALYCRRAKNKHTKLDTDYIIF